jgi:predicted O-linked N-acetylglucosamine transferase (SPINDLY family)
MPSRVAASISHALEMPEMVTHSYEEYENLAVRLSPNDSDRVSHLNCGLPEHIAKRPHGSLELKKMRAKLE